MSDAPEHDQAAAGTGTSAARRRRGRAVVAGAAAVALVAVAVVVTRGDGDPGTSESGQVERSSETGADRDDGATTTGSTDASASSTTSGGTAATTTTSGGGTTTGSAAPAPAPTSTPAGAGTTVPAPPPDLPGFSEENPEEPPATPIGPQGPVRPAACTSTGPPAIASSLTDGPSVDGKQWRTVGHLEGNCGGATGPFDVAGLDTRIVVRSDADQFLAFLEDTADPASNGGYADVVCRSRCSDQSVLTLAAGTYVLRVQATDGPWVADVQEYR